jgi:CheY-like chemotaxis protein
MPHALIIDDDLNNLVVLQEMLTHQGISYTAVQDPTKVEAILPQLEAVDVIFLDLEMPDIDGYQLFEILRTTPTLEQTPIVACTVHTGESHHARELGFHSFISKPLNVHQFPDQIRQILANQPIWDIK